MTNHKRRKYRILTLAVSTAVCIFIGQAFERHDQVSQHAIFENGNAPQEVLEKPLDLPRFPASVREDDSAGDTAKNVQLFMPMNMQPTNDINEVQKQVVNHTFESLKELAAKAPEKNNNQMAQNADKKIHSMLQQDVALSGAWKVNVDGLQQRSYIKYEGPTSIALLQDAQKNVMQLEMQKGIGKDASIGVSYELQKALSTIDLKMKW